MNPEIEIQWIAVLTAVACALPGTFLVLRRLSLLSDAISHSILLGIVLAFLVVQSLASPLLIVAAAATGVLTVSLVEVLGRSRLVREDAAIGLVFPALFSIGVILIARFAGDVHLDVDAVLLGELAFAPFDRITVGGRDWGPRILYVVAAITLLNAAFIAAFYKELKLSTFDAALAASLGFAPGLLHYLFMALVSVTAVGAFDAVGSVLVVALMIAPPAAAYLLTDRLPVMLGLAAGLGAAAAFAGYWMSYALDASIAGSIATACGGVFGLALIFAPGRGVLAGARRRRRQRWSFAQQMLAIHLFNHEHQPDAADESRVEHLGRHLRWDAGFARRVIGRAEAAGWLTRPAADPENLALTEDGRTAARQAMGIPA